MRKPMARQVDMSGRYVVITGATPGSIGYQVARTLAGWGANVAVTDPKDSASLVVLVGGDVDHPRGAAAPAGLKTATTMSAAVQQSPPVTPGMK